VEKFSRDARAREFAEPESANTKAQLGDRWITRRQPVSDTREVCGEERAGWERSRCWAQRHSVEGSGVRLGPSAQASLSHEQCSTRAPPQSLQRTSKLSECKGESSGRKVKVSPTGQRTRRIPDPIVVSIMRLLAAAFRGR